MQVKELSLSEMLNVFSVLSEMYPNLEQAKYNSIIRTRAEEGYRMAAVFDGETCLCAAGFWMGVRFYCGKFIQLDNMVTLPGQRNKGAGRLLVDWIKKLGKAEGCSKLLVDTYVENYDAHRFFLREGFIIRGYHLNYTL